MKKVIINTGNGSFGLSSEAILYYAKLKKINITIYYSLKDDSESYGKYIKKVGECIPEYLLFHCILPSGETFPEIVDINFINKNYFSTDNFSFLSKKDGKKLLNDFRSDNSLIQVVEELDELSWSEFSKLKVVSIPNDVIWEIWVFESGVEIIKEVSREWF